MELLLLLVNNSANLHSISHRFPVTDQQQSNGCTHSR